MSKTKLIDKCKAFVVSLELQPERLNKFYKNNKNSDIFIWQKAIYGKDLYSEVNNHFDLDSFEKEYLRKATPGEIGCTLSHIEIYKNVLLDNSINDEDFVIITEDDIVMHPNWYDRLDNLITNLTDCLDIDIVLLQHYAYKNYDFYNNIKLSKLNQHKVPNDNLYIYRVIRQDSIGSSFYIIRKKRVKQIIRNLDYIKPFWLADDFYIMGITNSLALTNPFLGYIPYDSESSLENDRIIARSESQAHKDYYSKLYIPSDEEIKIAKEQDKLIFKKLSKPYLGIFNFIKKLFF